VWNAQEEAWTIEAAAVGLLLDHLATLQISSLKFPVQRDVDDLDGAGLAEEPANWGWSGVSTSPVPRGRRLQRLLRLPPEHWADEEVLEILLGYAFPDLGPEVAAWLLERFGGFGGALAAEPPRLAEHPTLAAGGVPAVGDKFFHVAMLLKAVGQVALRSLREQIAERPVIGSWTALLDYLRLAMQHETAEHFRILFLDRKNILIRDEVQSRGTVDHTPLYPREVVKRALELAASAIIMVHNHPSGDPTPSQLDIDMTRQVTAALSQINITVHDHIIVGKNRHTSFKTQKLI
jgi:DNA repair protein RadC